MQNQIMLQIWDTKKPRAFPESALISSSHYLIQFFTILQIHVPRSLHRILVHVEPPLRILQCLLLLIAFILTSYIDRMYVLSFGLVI